MKICKTCKIEKELTEFPLSKNGKNGVRTNCKLCHSKYISAINKENRIKNGDEVREKERNSRKKYGRKQEYDKRYRIKHAEKIAKAKKEYVQKKYNNDPIFRLTRAIRSSTTSRIMKAGGKKSYKTEELLGCTIIEARNYLQSKFTEGMTLENWGKHGWHIDHIIPCSAFDLTDPEQQKICFHYTNLQPMWAEDNYKKWAHYPYEGK